MDVYLVQHGVACSKEQDPQRPLTDQGRGVAAKVADYLAARANRLIDPPIAQVRHSGKLRARQTAEILVQALCPQITPIAGVDMAPKDNPRTIYNELQPVREQPGAWLLVGHLPHLAKLAGLLLTGDANKTPVRFVNAAVLKICPSDTGWAVAWYVTPDCAQ